MEDIEFNREYFDDEYKTLLEKYYNEHCTCPKCGHRDYTTTMLAYILDKKHPEEYKNKNTIECLNCGWKGIKHDMVPEKKVI